MQKAPPVGAFFILWVVFFFDENCSKNRKIAKEFGDCVDNYHDGDEASGAYRNINFSLKDNYHGCY
jgi:hypothetical protein